MSSGSPDYKQPEVDIFSVIRFKKHEKSIYLSRKYTKSIKR